MILAVSLEKIERIASGPTSESRNFFQHNNEYVQSIIFLKYAIFVGIYCHGEVRR